MATQARLEKRVSDLSNELHLSNLLNKGALQNNQELTAQVTDLKRENAILRTAERRLTDTEDKLEACEEKLEDKTAEVARLRRTVAHLKERLEMEKVEAEDGLLDRLQDFIDKSRPRQNGRSNLEAGPSTPTPAKRRARQRDLPLHAGNGEEGEEDDEPLTRSKRRAARVDTDHAQHPRAVEGNSGPARPLQGELSSKKRRRRIGEEDDEQLEDPLYDPPYGTASTAMHNARPPSLREKRAPVIPLVDVKVEQAESDLEFDGWAEDDDDPL